MNSCLVLKVFIERPLRAACFAGNLFRRRMCDPFSPDDALYGVKDLLACIHGDFLALLASEADVVFR